MRVLIIGSGYVGLTTGAVFAFLGHDVVCYDIDHAKIDSLNMGQIPFYEPYLDLLVAEERKNGTIRFTTELEPWVNNAEVIFICVATPSSPQNGSVDLGFVRQAAYNVGLAIKAGCYRVIVNKSTVPVGSHEFVSRFIADGIFTGNHDVGDIHFATASNPEFLREGSAVWDALYPDRIVVGASEEKAVSVLRRLYEPVIKQSFAVPEYLPPRPEYLTEVPFVVTDPVSAEVIKYASNAFLAMKISFINEMANICERVGADV